MRSVMSTPVMRKRRRSSISGSGVHVHATESRRPSCVTHVLSCSFGGSPAATAPTSSRTSCASAGSTKSSQRIWSPISAGSYPSVCSKAMFAPPCVRRPSASMRQSMLGALFAIAFRNARSRSFSASRRRRSVTSIPDTRTSASVRPVTSATGTAVHKNARTLPSAQRSSDSTSSEAPPAPAVAIAAAAVPSSSVLRMPTRIRVAV